MPDAPFRTAPATAPATRAAPVPARDALDADDHRARVQGMFARIAGRYDLLNRVLSARRDVAWRKSALAMWEGRPEQVLDLACGTFDLGLEAIQQGRAAKVHASDFCLPMLSAGTRKRQGSPLSASVADAMALPFADGGFDGAMVAYGWRNFPDPRASARELARVLRPGGQLLILEFFRPTTWWPKTFYGTFGAVVFPAVGGLLAGDASAYRYLNASIARFLTIDEAVAALAEAGFTRLRTRSFFGGVSHAIAGVRA